MADIFKYFIPHIGDTAEETKRREGTALWFLQAFPETEFTAEDSIFYQMASYANEVETTISYRLKDIFLDLHLKRLIVTKNIHVAGTEVLSYTDPAQTEEALRITRDVINRNFEQMFAADAEISMFKADADAFMQTRLNERLVELYSNGFQIISSMKNKLMGTADALSYTTENLALISSIYSRENLEELDSVSARNTDGLQFVTDTGLDTIDSDCKGIYTTQLFGIEAPPGVGKTTFAVGTWAYRAAVIHNKNVLYVALEQDKSEIENMLIARHIYTLTGKQVPASSITKKLITPDLERDVVAARIDLFESGKYGKIEVQATNSLYYENFLLKLKSWDKLKGPFDLIILDYVTLIEQSGEAYTKALKDFEIAKKIYRRFKQYLRFTNKAGVAVNQLNADGSKSAEADKKASVTGASGGMETYRSTDYNIVISMTDQMKAQLKRRLSMVKTRSTEGFDSFLADVRMGIALFYQTAEKL